MILLLTLMDGERLLVNADDIGSIYQIAKAIRKGKKNATMMFSLYRKPKDPVVEKAEDAGRTNGFQGVAEKVEITPGVGDATVSESEPHFALVRVDDIRFVREVEIADVRIAAPKAEEDEDRRMPGRLVKGEFLIPKSHRRN